MNRNITRIVAIAATLAMGTSLAACGGSSADSSKGHVYFMNNKAEVVDQYKELASMYTKKTGVQVDIQTGAAGTYDATMKSELAKDNAPTMFNVAGFDQFAKYQKYVEPLQDTDVFKLLNDTGKAYSYTIDGNSYTLPYAAEWYGIIYNKKIIKDYCAKSYAVIKSADDIKDYKTLKQVAESIGYLRHVPIRCAYDASAALLRVSGREHHVLEDHQGHVSQELQGHVRPAAQDQPNRGKHGELQDLR